MVDPDQLQAFLREYVEYERAVLRPTYEEMRQVLSRWNDPENPAYWARYAESAAYLSRLLYSAFVSTSSVPRVSPTRFSESVLIFQMDWRCPVYKK